MELVPGHSPPGRAKGYTHHRRRWLACQRAATHAREDCKVMFFAAKDSKSAKEILARGFFQGFLLGALGDLGGSFCFRNYSAKRRKLPRRHGEH